MQLVDASDSFDAALAVPDAGRLTGAQPGAHDVRRYVVAVGDYGLLLPAEALCEVIEAAPGCRLPNTPEWFAGVINQRGTMVPVFDLAALLDAPGAAPRREWTLVVGQREHAVGLRLTRLPQAVQLTHAQRVPAARAPHALLAPFVSAAYQGEGAHWYEWDMDGFFEAAGKRLPA